MNQAGDQRRLSAVLAADVVGYTKLMEQDSEGTVAAWKIARSDIIDPTIKSYSGRIVKHTGDGFLAEFSTVENAVKCAISMQEGLSASSLDFRMGVNLGDIIDDGEDIHGEGVNIAARIEALAEPGGICVSGDVYNQIRNKLNYAFENMGKHEVKHVSAPVRVYRFGGLDGTESPQPTVSPSSDRVTPRFSIRRSFALASILLLTVVVAGYWWMPLNIAESDRGKFRLPDRPSIAVLSFDTFSNEDEQRFLAEGIAEDIITQLARNSELTVMARTATFAYKDKGMSAKEIAKILGVHYILEGSVRRINEQLRITSQLIEAKSGNHVWAEHYDVSAQAVLKTIDDIVEKISGTLFSEIRETEKAAILRRPPSNLDVYELTLRGLARKHKLNPKDSLLALEDLRQAVELDPGYAPAWLYLGWVEAIAMAYKWNDLNLSNIKDAIEKVEKAIELDPMLATAYQALSLLRAWDGEVKGALQAARRSVELGPGDADNLLFLGRALASVGEFDQAVLHARHAVALNPARPSHYDVHLARILWGQGNYEEANSYINECLTKAPGFTGCRIYHVASYFAMGDSDAASKAVDALLKQSPNLTVADALRGMGFPGDAKANERLAKQLTEAGLSIKNNVPVAN